jgi:hypothetical protein
LELPNSLGFLAMQVKEVIERAGGVVSVADAFGINRHSVYGWIYKNEVPAHRVPILSRMSDIPAEIIRPSMFVPKKQKTRPVS